MSPYTAWSCCDKITLLLCISGIDVCLTARLLIVNWTKDDQLGRQADGVAILDTVVTKELEDTDNMLLHKALLVYQRDQTHRSVGVTCQPTTLKDLEHREGAPYAWDALEAAYLLKQHFKLLQKHPDSPTIVNTELMNDREVYEYMLISKGKIQFYRQVAKRVKKNFDNYRQTDDDEAEHTDDDEAAGDKRDCSGMTWRSPERSVIPCPVVH